MNVERMTRFAYLLRNLETELPNVQFGIHSWYDDYGPCGTAACALGSACLWPEFKAKGLKISQLDTPMFSKEENDEDYELGYCAGCEFFDIDPSQSLWLFGPSQYKWKDSNKRANVTPEMVAVRIDALLSGYTELCPYFGYTSY